MGEERSPEENTFQPSLDVSGQADMVGNNEKHTLSKILSTWWW